jgi:hypothetical protein
MEDITTTCCILSGYLYAMKKITAYTVVSDESENYFVQKVNDHITQGWQPIQGIAIAMVIKPNTTNTKTQYSQALVKYEY